MSGLPDLPDEGDVKKRQMVIIAFVVIIILAALAYVYLTNSNRQIAQQNQQKAIQVDVTSPGSSADPIQNWVLQNENKMHDYEAQQARQQQATDAKFSDLMKQIKSLSQQNAQLVKDLKNPIGGRSNGLSTIPLPPRSTLPVNRPAVLSMPTDSKKPDTVANPDKQTGTALVDRVMLNSNNAPRIVKVKFNKKKGKKKRPHIRDTIPAGSFGQAVLLSGLDAPTGGLAERNPHPVLLELVDNGNLPNRYRHRVQQCRVVGSGTGNISDERAYIRLERMSCILKNGDIISEVVTGTVTGEDGKNGLRGTMVSKQGQIIANAFLAGALSNIGTAVADSYTTVATNPLGTVSTLESDKVLQAGAAAGVGTTMEKIADWYFKRAEETYPIIEISAGRVVNLFLTEDLPLGTNLLSNYTPESAHE